VRDRFLEDEWDSLGDSEWLDDDEIVAIVRDREDEDDEL
jgi:hypothetical protein